MALIDWDHGLSVSIPEIDQQHQELVALLNELHQAMGERRSAEALGGIIDGLVDYVATHFATEERYFDQSGYPEAEGHKAEHAAFATKAADFRKGFEEGRVTLSIEVLSFLADWVRNHIRDSDRKYVPLFRERGLA